MNAIQQLLTEHIDIWTGAETAKRSGRGRSSGNAASVYGIKKLRELILELAVRGKLVPQDANEEPASELLRRIQAEKAKLIADGKIKKEKPFAPISEGERPFKLPKGWEWVRNCQLFQLRKGRIPKNLNENGFGLPYLDIEALDRNFVRRYSEDVACPQSTEKDILVVCDGSRSGLVLDGKIGIIGSTLSIIDTPTFIQVFIKLIFKQGFEYFNTSMKGAAIPHLDIQKLLQNPTALPPLAEQNRIIAKVEELMALCEQLETQHNNAAEAHEKLVSHLLGTLTQSQNADDFSANWQCIYAHFDVLFTTQASIDALKQTLLQLAVMGKLVPQDPNDEPASELLKRIQAEKVKLIAEGKLKKEKPLVQISEDEKPFVLPQGWAYIRLNELLTKIGAGSTPLGGKQVYVPEGVPFLRSQNVYDDGLRLDDVAFITADTHNKMSGTHVYSEDLLFNITGASIGRCSIVPDGFVTGNVSQHVTIIRLLSKQILRFMHLVMISQYVQKTVMDVQVGVSREGLSIGKLGQFVIPIPPLAEQHRIVAKVDALMALCDQLKTRIQQAGQQQQLLADVLVARAVA
jgi:type I restriction enzyme S subunit